MPYPCAPGQTEKMHSCIQKVMARDASLDESAAIGICCNSIGDGKSLEQAYKDYKMESKDAPPGHEFYGNQYGGGGGGGSEGGGSSSGGASGGSSSGTGSKPGYASSRDEWRMVNRRLAAGGLKRGERRLLEKRAERLAREILGVPPEGQSELGKALPMTTKSRQARKARQAKLQELKAAQTKAELEAQAIADSIADLEVDDVGGLPIPFEEKAAPEVKDGMGGMMGDMPMPAMEMPYGGATTLADALAAMDADEQSEAMHEAVSLFQTVTSNILCDMMIEDKGAAIGAAAKELQALLKDPSPLMKETAPETPAEEKAQWDTATINNFPDSSFLYIKPGGEKDGEGKTVPRSLRMFPVKDGGGALDLPHLRNAIARIPQADIPKDKMTSLQERARTMLANAEDGGKKEKTSFVEWLRQQWEAFTKAGARHSMADQDHIQQAHDHLASAGAACEMKVLKGIDGQYYAFGYPTNNFRDRDYSKHPKGEVITEAAHKEFAAYLDAHPSEAPELWVWHTPGTARKARAEWWDYADGFMSYLWPLTEAEAKAFGDDESVAMSHGFYVLARDAKEGVINRYRSFECSDLPPEVAANPYTDLAIMRKELTEMFDPRKRDYLVKRLGEERVKELEAHPAEMAKALTELGVEHKEATPGQFTQVMPAAPEQIIEDLKKALNVEGLNRVITELQAQTKAQSEQITALTAQLGEAKKSDDEKIAAAITPKAGPFQWGHVATKDDGNKLTEEKVKEKGIPGSGIGSTWVSKLVEGASS